MDIATPETLGFSSQRLARINTVMQHYVDENKLAGIVTLVARRNEVVHLAKCGMADIDAGLPMEFDTLFRIFSMTKPITSTAVLMLYEEGRLRLTDPVSQYIPAFKDVKVLDYTEGSGVRQVDPVRPVTIRDLLTHTAGLSYGFDEGVYVDESVRKHVWTAMEANPDLTLEAFVAQVAKVPLAHQPGTRFRYSLATDVLGFLAQIISGMPFDDFLKRRIFEPLGMPDTDFWAPPEKIGRLAVCYGPAEGGGLQATNPRTMMDYTRHPKIPSGGGGLVSTIVDYLRFCRMLLNKGELDGVRLLGRKTVELMTTNHLPDGVHPDDPAYGFGLGVNVLMDLGKSQTLGSIGSFGWGGAANTNFWIDPVEELIGILMLQFMPSETYPVAPDFRILAYQALVD